MNGVSGPGFRVASHEGWSLTETREAARVRGAEGTGGAQEVKDVLIGALLSARMLTDEEGSMVPNAFTRCFSTPPSSAPRLLHLSVSHVRSYSCAQPWLLASSARM